MKKKAEELPHALDSIEEIFKRIGKKKPSLFLDFDGTLAPIVADPDAAQLSEGNGEIISELARKIPIAMLSGRDRQDLESRVSIENAYYAGSHGFDITGPDNLQMQHEAKKEIIPTLDAAEENLKDHLKDIPGVFVERKKYAIAVHYRNVEEKYVEKVKEIVDQEIKRQESLKKGPGKKIVELKPNLDWHKGRALDWLTDNLGWSTNSYFRLFIGDDITDEDAFEAVKNDGIGIIVGSHESKTAASYRLKDTTEVTSFLREIKDRLE